MDDILLNEIKNKAGYFFSCFEKIKNGDISDITIEEFSVLVYIQKYLEIVK